MCPLAQCVRTRQRAKARLAARIRLRTAAGRRPRNRSRPMEPIASHGIARVPRNRPPNHSHSAEPITPKKREPGGGCRRAREERREEGVQLWGSAGNLASGGVPLTASIQPPHAWRILRMSLKGTRKNHRSCTTTAARARHGRDSDHMIARLRHDADRGASWTRDRRECRHSRSAPGRRFDAHRRTGAVREPIIFTICSEFSALQTPIWTT